MRNTKIIFLLILSLFAFSTIGCEKEKTIDESELPLSVKTYLETHFADCNILKVAKDTEDGQPSIDIDLDCGVNIEFYATGQVIDIDGTSKLPDSVIPDEILAYTATHYPNDFIIGWDLEGDRQQVELNTDIELEFDMDGNFLRVVD